MEQKKNIIITDTLSGIGTEAYKGYLGHALCLEGVILCSTARGLR